MKQFQQVDGLFLLSAGFLDAASFVSITLLVSHFFSPDIELLPVYILVLYYSVGGILTNGGSLFLNIFNIRVLTSENKTPAKLHAMLYGISNFFTFLQFPLICFLIFFKANKETVAPLIGGYFVVKNDS